MIKKLNKVKELNGKYIIKYERIELKENYLLLNENEYKYSLESINIKEYFEENAKYKLLLDICNGIKEFHSNKLINGNIKPSNILFNEIGEYKLSDYMKNELFKNSNEIILNKKSINYLSPEILKNEELNEKSDIWSIGCILYLLMNGTPPFEGSNQYAIQSNILTYNYHTSKNNENYKRLNKLLSKVLCLEENRLNIHSLTDSINEIYNYKLCMKELKEKQNAEISNLKNEMEIMAYNKFILVMVINILLKNIN